MVFTGLRAGLLLLYMEAEMNSQSISPRNWYTARFSAIHSSFEGAEVIRLEKPRIFRTLVSQISWDEWGMKATLVDSLMPGMHRLRHSPCEISAALEIFAFSAGEWQATYVPWRVFFDPMLVRSCIELGGQASQKGSTLACNDPNVMKLIFEHYRRTNS
jgi:hypothetical protein